MEKEDISLDMAIEEAIKPYQQKENDLILKIYEKEREIYLLKDELKEMEAKYQKALTNLVLDFYNK